ncbi:MAG: hypothetical protein AB8G11_07895 [Saprospiraceae bacterium]
MRKVILLAFVGILISATAFGQKDETLFNKLKFTGAWGGSTFHYAQVGEGYTTLSGGYGGLEFRKDIFIGFGSYNSVSDFFSDNTSNRYNMNYSGLLLGYSPKAHKTLHLQTNLMLGNGNIRNVEIGENDNFVFVQPYLGVELNVVRWMRVSVGGGYRAVFDNSLPANISNAYGELRLKFGWSWGR